MSQPVKILIIGNGFGGVYSLKNLHKFFHGDPEVEFSLVGQNDYFLFTPLLHEVATAAINPDNIIEPIQKVLGCCLDNFYLGKAELINLKERTVGVGNTVLSYDYLILAPGAQTNFYDIPGAEKYSLQLKSIQDAIKIKNHCIGQMQRATQMSDRAQRKKMLKFAIVGGGATGVELAAELQELIKESFPNYCSKEVVQDASVVLIQKMPELIPMFGLPMRQKSLQVLRKKGVEVMLDTEVKEVTGSSLLLGNDVIIFTETIIWTAGIKPTDLQFEEPVKKSADGRLLVNQYLQLENYPEVFAIGDVAAFADKNTYLPSLAQVAEKEAKAAAKNIRLLVRNKSPEPFRYHHFGILISLGQWMAIGEIFNFSLSGRFTWWLWRTVYLSKLISWRKKAQVAWDWTVNLFYSRNKF